MNITRSTRKSKMKNMARIAGMSRKLTLSIVSILSCLSVLFVGAVASTIDPSVEIDNPISYTSDIAFEKNPAGVEFYIRTYEDLQVLSNLVNANAVITGTNISYSSATYTLLNDIENTSGETLNPIGNGSSPFIGTFNGNGKKITNLVVTGTSYVGLFGNTLNAKIGDITIESGSVTGSGNYVASLVGNAVNTEITNITNNATVTSTGSAYTGGLIGKYSNNTGEKITLTKLLNNGNVNASSSNNTAGLVGALENACVTNSSNTGNVTGNTTVGGLIGEAVNTVTASQLVEEKQVLIENVFNSGNVTGNSNVAGMVAVANGASNYAKVYLTSGYSVAQVKGEGGTITASATNTEFSAIYYLENMGGTHTEDTICVSGENMSGADALATGKLHGLDSSFFSAVENEETAYKLPQITALKVGATIHKITYDLNGGVAPDDDTIHTKFFKPQDEITLMTPTFSGMTFLGWENEEGEIATADDIEGTSSNISLKAVWEIITPVVTITDSEVDHTRTYGDRAILTAVFEHLGGVDYAISWTLAGKAVGTEEMLTLASSQLPGTYNYMVTVTASVGGYTVSSSAEQTIVVEKRALTITTSASDMVYGTTLEDFETTLSVTYEGFVNGDTESSLEGVLEYILTLEGTEVALADIQTHKAGSYVITTHGLTSDSYEIAYIGAEFEITKRNLTITAGSATKPYDGIPLKSEEFTTENLVNGDYINTEALTFAGSITEVGVTANVVSGSGNIVINGDNDLTDSYEITYINGTLTVNPLDIMVAVTGSMVYGESAPEYAFDFTGTNWTSETKERLEEAIKSQITLTIKDSAGNIITDFENALVGPYDIVLSANNSNFNFAFLSSLLTISEREITVTVGSYTGVYDGLLHNAGHIISGLGLADGDTDTILTSSIKNVGTMGSEIISYKFMKGDTDVTHCYIINEGKGTLTVTKASLTVSVTLSKNEMTYGDIVPDLTLTYTGFVNGDTSTILTGVVTFSGADITTKNGVFVINNSIEVGTYNISVSGLTSSNYEITFVPAELKVTEAKFSVTAEWDSQTLGQVNFSVPTIGPSTVNVHPTSFTLILMKDGVEIARVTYDYADGLTSHNFSQTILSNGEGEYTATVTAHSINSNVTEGVATTEGLFAHKVTLVKGDSGIDEVRFNGENIESKTDDAGNIYAIFIYDDKNNPTITIVSTLADTSGGFSFGVWGLEGVTSLTKNGEAIDLTSAEIAFDLPNANLTLTATSKVLNLYNLSYNPNGGTLGEDVINPTTFRVTDTITIINQISRAGYRFAGWRVTSVTAWESDDNETSWELNTSYSAGEVIEAGQYGDLELTAVWEKIDYTISFDLNGGSGVEDSLGYTTESTETLGTPSKDGYTFIGWKVVYSSGNWEVGETYLAGFSVAGMYGNVSLVAEYETITYTITFDLAGGSGETTLTYTIESTDTLPLPTFAGYTFGGWKATTGSGNWEQDKIYSVNYLLAGMFGDVTLTAIWSNAEYIIILNGNGGAPAEETKKVTYQSAYGDLPTAYRNGYTFMGWFTKSEGGTEVLATTIVTATGEHTLYAQWKVNKFTLKIEGNKPTNATANIEGTFTSVELTFDKAQDLGLNPFSLTGWKFSKFSSTTNGEGTNFTTLNLTVEQINSLYDLRDSNTNITTLYAIWTPNTYIVTYNKNKPADVADEVLGTTEDSLHTYDLTGVLTVNGYNLTGYSLAGWATESGGAVAYQNGAEVKNLTAIDGDTVTLYAVWTANGYTVNLNPNCDAGVVNPASITVIYGETYGELPVATRTGYTFIGWFTESDGGTQITADTEVTITSHQTLYAHWQINTYNLTIKTKGFVSTAPEIELTLNGIKHEVTYGTDFELSHTYLTSALSITIEITGGTKYHIDFAEIMGGTNSFLTSIEYPGKTYTYTGWTPNENKTLLLAPYELFDVNISAENGIKNAYFNWKLNDGTLGNNLTSASNVFHGSTITLVAEVGTGYSFTGWVDEEGNVVSTNLTHTITSCTESLNLTATAEYNKYTIVVKTVDGSNLTENYNATYGAPVEITAFTREGYSLSAWNCGDYASTAMYGTSAEALQKIDTFASLTGTTYHFKNLSEEKDGVVTITLTYTLNAPQISIDENISKTYGEGYTFVPSITEIDGLNYSVRYEDITPDTAFDSLSGNNLVFAYNTPAGSYSANVVVTVTDAYGASAETVKTINLKVNAKELTITLDKDSYSTEYGVSTTLTASISGFISGESADNLTNPNLSASYSSSISRNGNEYTILTNSLLTKGTYTITLGGLSSTNYSFTYDTATLEILVREITLTANSASKVYDGTALSNDGYTITSGSLINGDELTLTVEGSQTNVGEGTNAIISYIIKNNDVDVTGSYKVTLVDGTLTVTARPITITANSGSKVYDGAPLTAESLGYKITSGTLATGQTILASDVTYSGTQTIVGTRASKVTAVIIKSGSTNVTSNYNITFVDGTLGVTKATFKVTANWNTTNLGTLDISVPAIGTATPSSYTIVIYRKADEAGEFVKLTEVSTTSSSYDFAELIKTTGSGEYKAVVTANVASTDASNVEGGQGTTNPNLFAYTITLVKNDAGIASVEFKGDGIISTHKVVEKTAGLNSTALSLSELSAHGMVTSATNPTAGTHYSYELTSLEIGKTYILDYTTNNDTNGKISVDVYNGDTLVSNDVTQFTVNESYTYIIKFYLNSSSSNYSGTLAIEYRNITLYKSDDTAKTNHLDLFSFFTYITQATYIYGTDTTVTVNSTASTESGQFGGYSFDEWQVRPEGTTLSFVTKGDGTNYSLNDAETTFKLPNVDVFMYSVSKADKKYNITYNANGGTISGTYSTEHTVLDAVTLPSNVTKTGHTFLGWQLTSATPKAEEVNLTGNNTWLERYSVGDTFTAGQILPAGLTGEATFTAVWEVNDILITITFDAGIESATVITTEREVTSTNGVLETTAKYGTEIELSAVIKYGYRLDGFGGNPAYNWGLGTITIIDEECAISIYTILDTYNVYYQTNGGSGSAPSDTVQYNTNYTIQNNTSEKTGYTFVGWNTSADGTGTTYQPGDVVQNLEVPYFDEWDQMYYTYLYAIWEANTYTVTISWASNKLTNVPQVQVVATGANVNKVLNMDEGITITHTYSTTALPISFTITSKDATLNRYYYMSLTVDGYYYTHIAYSNRTLNWSWTPTKNTTVGLNIEEQFNAVVGNGEGVLGTTFDWYTNDWWKGNGLTSAHDMLYGSRVTLKATMQDGYSLDGWYDQDGNLVFAYDSSDTNWSISGNTYSYTFTGLNRDYNLTAKGTANRYTVSFDSNGGTTCDSVDVTYGEAYGTLPTPTRTGYNFLGWNGKNLVNIADQTLTSTTNTNEGSIHFKIQAYLNGSYASHQYATASTGKVKYTFTKDSTFDSFKMGLNGNNTDVFAEISLAHLINGQQYTISLDLETLELNKIVMNNIMVEAGSTATAYEPYIVTSSTTVTKSSNHTLTAVWEIKEITVNFNPNGGSVSPTTKTVTYNNAYGTLPTPTRAGYTFVGWSMGNVAQFSNMHYTTGLTVLGSNSVKQTVPTAGTTDYSIITSITAGNTYYFSYTRDNTSGTLSIIKVSAISSYYTIASTISSGSTFTAESGYVYILRFVGASSSASYAVTYSNIYVGFSSLGKTYKAYSGITSTSTVTNEDNHTLYAVWKHEYYDITYNANGGTVSPSWGAYATVSCPQTVTLPTPTREGYTFTGWSTNMFNLEQFANNLYRLKGTYLTNAGTTTYSNGAITLTPSAVGADCHTNSYSSNTGYMVTVKPSTTYTFSWTQSEALSIANHYIFFWTSNTASNFSSFVFGDGYHSSHDRYYITFTTPADCTALTFRFGIYDPSKITTLTFSDVWLLEGTGRNEPNYSISGNTLNLPAGTYGNIPITAQWEAEERTLTFNYYTGATTEPTVVITIDGTNYTLTKGKEFVYTRDYGESAVDVSITISSGSNRYYYDFYVNDSYYTWGAGAPATGSWGWGYNSGYITDSEDWHFSIYQLFTLTTATSTGISSATFGWSYGSTNVSSTYSSNGVFYNAKATFTAVVEEGYNFLGWYDQSGNLVNGNATFTISSVKQDYKLTARANLNNYTVNYTLNGGTHGASAPTNWTYGVAQQISNPTRTGYIFTGWTSTTVDSESAQYGNGTDFYSWDGSWVVKENTYFKNLSKTNGGTVTMIANWTPITYSYTVNLNGGTFDNSATWTSGGYSVSGENATYSGARFGTSYWVSSAVSKTGYTFAGWKVTNYSSTAIWKKSTDSSYTLVTGTISITTAVNTIHVQSLTTANGASVTLTAIWTPNTYTVYQSGDNMLHDGTFDYTTYNENIGWDNSKNGYYTAGFWSTYNGGVPNASAVYHAHIKDITSIDSVHGNVIEYVQSGNEDWLGISQSITGVSPGTYILSFEAYGVSGTNYPTGGLYYCNEGSTTYAFNSGTFSASITRGAWTRFSYVFEVKSINAQAYAAVYIYGHNGGTGTFYLDNVTISKATSTTHTYDEVYEVSKPSSSKYNLNGVVLSYGLSNSGESGSNRTTAVWGTSSTNITQLASTSLTLMSNGSGSIFVKNLSIYNGSFVVLDVIWSPRTVTVTLDPADGRGTTKFYYKYDIPTYYSDSACTTQITSITPPSKTGYTFNGYHYLWTSSNYYERYTTELGAIAYDLCYDIYWDCTLTLPTGTNLGWIPNTYTVIFNPNGGSVSPTSKTITYGSAFGTLPTPTRSGYNFTGWMDGGTAYGTNAIITSSTIVTHAGGHEVYAQWQKKTLTVEFGIYHSHGGTLTGDCTATKTLTHGDTITLTGTASSGYWTWRFYKFNSAGTELAYYNFGTTYTITEADTDLGYIKFVAYFAWSDNKIASTNFDTGSSGNTTGGYVSGEWNQGNWYGYLGNGHTGKEKFTIYAKPNAGYYFYGWFVRVAPTASNYNTGIVYASASDCTYNSDGYYSYTVDATKVNPADNYAGGGNFYALFLPNNYTVTFNANGGSVSPTSKSVEFNSTYGTLPTPTRTGYTFVGWRGKNLINVENQTITTTTNTNSGSTYFKIQTILNTTFVSQPYSTTTTGNVVYTFTKASTFNALKIGLNGNMADACISFSVAHLTDGAQYTISLDLVTLELNKIVMNNIMIEAGSTATTFEPYYITSSTKVVQPNNHTLTAEWQINSYSLTVNMGTWCNATAPTIDVTIGNTTKTLNSSTSSVTFTHNYSASAVTITFTLTDGTRYVADIYNETTNVWDWWDIQSSTTKSHTKWTPNQDQTLRLYPYEMHDVKTSKSTGITSATYDWYYNDNNKGSGLTSYANVFHNSTVTFKAVVVSGYTFSGWYNASGTLVSSSATYEVSITQSYNLTAKATANGYYVDIDENGGATVSNPSNYSTSTSSQTRTLTEPTRTGYTFAGWVFTTNTSGSSSTISGNTLTIPAGAYGNIVVKATWTANTYTLYYTSGGNLLTNSDFENYYSSSSIGWDNSKNGTLAPNGGWGSGYNSGVSNPTTGYHAHMKDISSADSGHGKVMEYVNENGRWLGVSQNLYLEANTTYVLTMDCYRVSGSSYITAGLYYDLVGDTGYDFHSGCPSFGPNGTGVWERWSFVFTTRSDMNTSVYQDIYVYGASGGVGTIYVDNVTLYKGVASSCTYDGSAAYLAAQSAPTGYTWQGWSLSYGPSSHSQGFNSSTALGGTTSSPTTAVTSSTQTFGANDTYFKNMTPTNGGIVVIQKVITRNVIKTTMALNDGSGQNHGTLYHKYGVNVYYADSNCTTVWTSWPVPSRTGYTFGGYYVTWSDGTSTTYITSTGAIGSGLCTISWNMTLNAKWTANTYNLTFNANGGSVSPTSKTITYGSPFGTLPTPTRSGYNFTGWMDGGTAYGTNAIITSSTIVTFAGGHTLYAQWSAKPVTVTVRNYTGTTTEGTVSGGGTYYVGDTITITATPSTGFSDKFNRWIKGTNYWNDALASSEKSFEYTITTADGDAGSITFTTGYIIYQTVYAYTQIGGSAATHTNHGGGVRAYEAATQSYTSGNGLLYMTTTQTVTQYADAYTGYYFNGWYTSNTFSADTKVSSDAVYAHPLGTSGDNIVLYALFSCKTYTYVVDLNGGAFGQASNWTSGGYSVSGSTATLSNIYYDRTYWVNLYEDVYRTGYTLAGWKFTNFSSDSARWGTTSSSMSAVPADGLVSNSELHYVSSLTGTWGGTVTITAQWSAISYSYTVNLNGGTFDNSATWTSGGYSVSGENATYSGARFGTAYWVLSAVSKTGHTFAGWKVTNYSSTAIWKKSTDSSYTSVTGTISITSAVDTIYVHSLTATAGATVTLTAIWTPIPYTFTFNFNLQDGQTKTATIRKNYGERLTQSDIVGYDLYGYDFLWWKNTTSSAGTIIVDKSHAIDDSTEINKFNVASSPLGLFNENRTFFACYYNLLAPATLTARINVASRTNTYRVDTKNGLIYLTHAISTGNNYIITDDITIDSNYTYYTYSSSSGFVQSTITYKTVGSITTGLSGGTATYGTDGTSFATFTDNKVHTITFGDASYANFSSTGMFNFFTGELVNLNVDFNNISIVGDSIATDVGGLIRTLQTGSTIKNVCVLNLGISLTSTSSTICVGGVVGSSNGTVNFNNVSYDGLTINATGGSYAKVGGIVGLMSNPSSSSGFTGGTSYSIRLSAYAQYTVHAGGAIGEISSGSLSRISNFTLKSKSGNNEINGTSTSYGSRLGGAIGYINEQGSGFIVDNFTVEQTDITDNSGNNSGITAVGGLVGYAYNAIIDGTHDNSYNLFDFDMWGHHFESGGEQVYNGYGYYSKKALYLYPYDYEECYVSNSSPETSYVIEINPNSSYILSWTQNDTADPLTMLYFWSDLTSSPDSTLAFSESYNCGNDGYRYYMCFSPEYSYSEYLTIDFGVIGLDSEFIISDIRLVEGDYEYAVPETTYSVTNCNITGGYNVGGVIGEQEYIGRVTNVNVQNIEVTGLAKVGGIVGYSHSSTGSISKVTSTIRKGYALTNSTYNDFAISWCHVYGATITSTSYIDLYDITTDDGYYMYDYEEERYGSLVGGIAGLLIEDSIVAVETHGTTVIGEYGATGGIAGGTLNSQAVAYALNTGGSVTTTDSNAYGTGGIVGYWAYYDSSNGNSDGGISTSVNYCSVSGGYYVGGVVGLVYGSTTGYTSGTFGTYQMAVNRSANHGAVNGYTGVGGVVGANYNNNQVFNYNSNTGSVTATGSYKSGIIGDFDGSDCYSGFNWTTGFLIYSTTTGAGYTMGYMRSSHTSNNNYYLENCAGTTSVTAKTGEIVKNKVYMSSYSFASALSLSICQYNGYTEVEYMTLKNLRANGDKYISIMTQDLFDKGTNSDGDTVFFIEDNSDLSMLRKAIADGSQTSFGKPYATQIYYVTANIATCTSPVGSASNPFQGTFRSGTKTSNSDGTYTGSTSTTQRTITVNFTSTSADNVGLFGALSWATIRYITVTGTVKGNKSVGGIAGSCGNSTISNCSSSATITANQEVGGIVGSCWGKTVSYCTNSGAITGGSGGGHGGIVGACYGSTVENCTNSANLSGFNVGGIYGWDSGENTISNCTTSSGYTVTGNGSNVGGIGGLAVSGTTIEDCTNNMVISASSYDYVGGIVGHMTSASVTDCINKGNVNGHYEVGGLAGKITSYSTVYGTVVANYNTVNGTKSVGGLVGSIHSNSSVGGSSSSYIGNSGTVYGKLHVGGVVGWVGSGYEELAIVYASNSGSVYCTGAYTHTIGTDYSYLVEVGSGTNVTTTLKSANYKANVGGVVGYCTGDVMNVKNTGSVRVNSSNAPNISVGNTSDGYGASNVAVTINSGALVGFGGIVGWLAGESWLISAQIGANITVGISSTSSSKGVCFVGGFCGYVGGNATMSTDFVGTSNLTFSNYTNNTLTVNGSYFLGGAVGYANGTASVTKVRGPFDDPFNPGSTIITVQTGTAYNISAKISAVTINHSNPSGSYENYWFNQAAISAATASPNTKIGCLASNAYYAVKIGSTVYTG